MKRVVLAAALMLAITAGDAIAQTSAAVTIGGTVEQSLYISVSQPMVTFANATAADFAAGHVNASGGELTHKGNVPYLVTVAADVDFMQSGEAPTTKPASDVLWSIDELGFTGLTTVGMEVIRAAAGEGTAALSYRMLLNWGQDSPATYTLPVTYTIAAQ